MPTNRGTYEVNRVWQPNVVAQQVQQVQYVPQTVTEQVPVQVTSYRPEQVVQKVPYQTCRIVQQEMVRKVPYTVSRPVTQHVDRKVPVQVTRMVTEEQVRRVPYQTCRMVQEERVEQVPVQVCRMEAYEETVRIPHVVEKRIPVTCNYTVPHVECYRVPVDDCCPTACDVSVFKLLQRAGRRRGDRNRARRNDFSRRPTPAPTESNPKIPSPPGGEKKPELGHRRRHAEIHLRRPRVAARLVFPAWRTNAYRSALQRRELRGLPENR